MDIILCATQRCGSTLIVEDMRNTGILGMPEEWFISWSPEKTSVDWADALASTRRRATTGNGVFAIKVMANQVPQVDGCLASVVAPAGAGLYPHFAAAFPDAKWVWLRRDDVVSQAISRIMSQQTGINHATGTADQEHFAGNLARGYDGSYNEKTVYRYGAILRQVTAIVLENLAWTRFFESHGIEPVELVYEEVIAREGMDHLDTLAELAGLTDRPERKPRTMVKVGNERNRQWREQFFGDAAANGFRPVPKNQLAG